MAKPHQPLVYSVSWSQFSRIMNNSGDRWLDSLVERVASVLGEKAAAEVMFELESGRCPRFMPRSESS